MFSRILKSLSIVGILCCGCGGVARCTRREWRPRCLVPLRRGAGGVLHDSSGNANDGVISAATWVAGRSGSALSFNGRNSWVTVPDSPSLDLTNVMTIEAWVKPAQLSGSWRTVVVKELPGQLAYALYAHGAGPGPSIHANTGSDRYATTSSTLPVGRWTFLSGTYDGATLRLYVDGVLKASLAATGSIPDRMVCSASGATQSGRSGSPG